MGYGQLYMFSSILKGPEQNKCIPTRAKVGNMYIHIDIYVYIYIYYIYMVTIPSCIRLCRPTHSLHG